MIAEVDSRMAGLDDARSLDLYAHVEERLARLPGVQTASIGALVPMGVRSTSRPVRRAGVQPAPGSEPTTPEAGRRFYAPWNAIGARASIRYTPTLLNDDDAADFCDPFGFCQGALQQIEIAVGAVVRF